MNSVVKTNFYLCFKFISSFVAILLAISIYVLSLFFANSCVLWSSTFLSFVIIFLWHI